MAALVHLGKELGYEGRQLREIATKQQDIWATKQQHIHRADTAAEREAEEANG